MNTQTLLKFMPIVGVVILSLVSILPLFHAGFFPIHDDTQVARVFEMHKSLSDGLFPVRWVEDLGYSYGYPIFSFYAPLAYYIGAFFMFFGFAALTSTKIMIGLGVILAGVTMYLFTSELLDAESAMVAAILYIFAPYHAVNIFVRGAIGEIWAYAFIPLAFYGFLKVARNPSWKSCLIAIVGFAGVIISHNLTALLIAPFLGGELIVLFFQASKKSTRKLLVISLLLALAVSSWYWLPALTEMQYTNVVSQTVGGSEYKDHFVCLSQLWSSQWGFGGSAPGCLDGLSFELGKIHVLLGVIGILLAVFFSKTKKRGLALLSGGGLVLAIFLMLPVSKPLWDNLPFMKYLQFPWRYLQAALFFLSLLGGIAFSEIRFDIKRLVTTKYLTVIALGFGVVIIIAFYAKLFKPQFYYDPYRDETTRKNLVWTISKISDEYMPSSFIKPKSYSDVPRLPYKPSNSLNVTIDSHTTSHLALNISAADNQHIVLNLAYFPAWQITLDKTPASFAIGHGLYDVVIPKGQHTLDAVFVQTPAEKIANLLSVLGILISVIGIIVKRR
ncbi:MAG TPA: 6-pyruvoyl-tetrahydropterin synthase-related protein, partial [Patescibacteria group bacterium]|nr:6-pyruvoyl-tetrahydropterin synthase-related protein [Patescibacteria group bacterium]